MAYQQQYGQYQQPRQQQQPQQAQYYNQHDNQYGQQQYDEYGYDQSYYDQQWDEGYYDNQHGGWEGQPQQQQQQQQGRRPPPQRDAYAQGQQYNDQYQQDARARPVGNGQPPQPPQPQRGRGGLRPPGSTRAALSPVSPKAFTQDNPFPVFPSQSDKRRPKAGSMDEAMSLMTIGHENEEHAQPRQMGPPQTRMMRPPQGRGRGMPGPPQQRGPPRLGPGHPDMQRQDSGHFEGNGRGQRPPPNRGAPMNGGGRGYPPQRPRDPTSPTQQSFGPGPGPQRSMTMPQNISGPPDGRDYNAQQQWTEPGVAGGYQDMPPRPSTAGGTRPNRSGRPEQFEQRPPMPAMPPARQQQYQDNGESALDNVYDDYYGDAQDRQSKASSIDMPNFDAIPEPPTKGHRRGYSIENHLSPVSSTQPAQGMTQTVGPGDAPPQQNNFYQQASRSRSQPDLHGQYAQGNGTYGVAADAPAMPPLPGPGYSQNGLPGGPGGRGGPMPRGPPTQGYGPGQTQNYDPRYGRGPPQVHRGYSDDSAYSEPGPNTMRNGSPMVAGNIPRPGTAAPAPGRVPSDPIGRRPGTSQANTNPDALPAHPLPVRPGLMQQQPQGQAPAPQTARPPPIRQYNTDPTPIARGNQQGPTAPQERPASVAHPVTHDELNRLRATIKNNPADGVTGLKLAKRLQEAAVVLADEGGTADTRSANKNREKFIFEAHKVVKKLAAGGSPDAMFYLADCYGQGLLGLQVDTKEAFTLYQSAAKAGHAASAYRTAVCCEMGHEEGGGTKKDPVKAVQWYRRAAALGDVPAMYKMGMILLKGLLGQQKNLGEAINMLKRAADYADEQNPHALHELALLYEAQTGNERVIRDEGYAFQLFGQAAELGYKFSQFRLGQAYEYGLLGCPIDARLSLAWYTRAAAQEEHQSELALSGWYLTGSQGILEQSDNEAYLWARKAACAEPPLSKALFAMGYFTEVGIGCPRSLDEAKRWYGRAAAYKFPKAQERLEELKRGGSKVQMKRERLSRSNQKQQEENCTVM